MAEPIFVWGSVDTDSFIKSLRSAYAEAVHWRRNCFKVPSGNIGNSFVSELARLYNAFATGSALESVVMEAAMTMPILLLQKPHRTSKMKDHIACLERRLESWKDGDIVYLLEEGRTIQQRLHQCPRLTNAQDSPPFFSLTDGQTLNAFVMNMDEKFSPG